MLSHKFNLQNTHLIRILTGFGFLFCLSVSTYAIGVCAAYNFNTSPLPVIGTNPRQVLTGDVNGNGTRDTIVIAGNSSGSNFATVLLNDGRGNLTTFTSIPLNSSAASAALADFNSDGNPDLVVGGTSGFSNTSQAAVFINNGDGVFALQNTLAVQGSITAVEAGDFNADGAIDIAAATSSNNIGQVSLLLNDGLGNFFSAGNFSLGGTPRDAEIADFNNDGVSDIITLNNNSSVSILLGNSSGNFQLASNIVLSTNSFSYTLFAVGDLNNDNLPDLVLSATDSTTYSVALNVGGNFPTPTQTTLNDFNLRIRSIAVGQVVGNSNLDVVFGIGGGFGESVSEAAILQGNGNGTFNSTAPVLSPTGTAPASIAIADLNNDGRNDVVTANSTSGDISVLINYITRFGPNTYPVTTGSNVIASADIDGDGNLDAITGSSTGPSSGNTNLMISYGNGRGGVSNTQTVSLANAIQFIIAADFNADSRQDILVASVNPLNSNTSSVNLFLNRSGAALPIFDTIPSATLNVGFAIKNLVIGDFNNDGTRDIVAGSLNGNTIAFIPVTAAGNYSTFTSFATPVNNISVAAGNFNSDNRLDLAIAGFNNSSSVGAVYILFGNGNGTFSQFGESVPVTNPSSIVSGDFNGDSTADIAVTSPVSTSSGSSTVVAVALGIGGGRFSQPVSYPVGLDGRSITAADFNGDNRLDLVVANRSSNSFSLLTNLGAGNFSSANNFLAGVFPESLTVGDFNNDGRAEIATANRGGNNFSLILNFCLEAVTKTDYTGEGKSDFAVFRPSNGTWYVLGSDYTNTKIQTLGGSGDTPTPGDFDGDGRTDIAVFRPSNGTWYILRSSNNRSLTIAFGTNGDIPVAADYDGDGKSDIAVFRPSNGTWYIRRGLTAQSQFSGFQFGSSGDRPVPADYDGDGKADLAIYRDGLWVVLRSSNSSVTYQQFGVASDIPLIGDFDGDGKSDLAVYRGGSWFILASRTNLFRAENFGIATDKPQPADFDGDGRTDIAVFRPGDSNWYVLNSSDRQIRAVNWGLTNDVPVTSLYRN